MRAFIVVCCWMFAGLPALLCSQDVTVTSEINQQQEFTEYEQLQGNITIIHDNSQKVDIHSFRLGNKPLQVTFSSDVTLSPESGLVMSTYQFTLPGQPNGLYILPAVTVNVGSSAYSSLPNTYTVQATLNVPQQGQGPNQSYLELNLQFKGAFPLYPGQNLVAIYSFVFNNSLDMTEEILPALTPSQGFTLVGAQQSRDYVQNASNVHEISQELQAAIPGIYEFPESKITGYVYMMSPFGGRFFLKPPLTAVTPPITITISPFPDQGKPSSFTGAIGPFTSFNAILLSPSNSHVGDKIVLQLSLEGSGLLDTAHLSDLNSQPGFSGLFKAGDQPPTEEIHSNVKHFTAEIYLLKDSVNAVPAVEFSFFDPASGQYGTLRSQPIPIEH